MIDLNFAAGGDDFVNFRQVTKVNFTYETKLLDIPEGTDENLELLENEEEEIVEQRQNVNEKLEETLKEMTQKLYADQYNEFVNMNEIIYQN